MHFKDEWLVPTLTALVPESEMEAIRAEAGNTPGSLWETLVAKRRLTDAEILAAISTRFRLPLADLSGADPHTHEAVPEQLVRKYNVLPLRMTDSLLEVASANPFDIDAEKMLAFATGREVRMVLASPRKIRDKLDEVYRANDVVAKLLTGMADNEITQLVDEPEDLSASAEEAAARPIIKLVDTLIADGITSRASDIHVEPTDAGIIVRYRIDGVLREIMKIPRKAGIPLISRMKIMSGMDIADRLRPQDGRARVAVNGNPVDLRVSSLPASHGEKVVIRILDQKGTVLTLNALGMLPDERETIEQLVRHKEGIVLVTGPTGSGKTTTLYAALRLVQNTGVNIVTVEDPVEYRLGANIVQVQTNDKAGLTFASALRSILRQDPDVVLIGEIRDVETAQIAVQASLTGHLVLSTLHTNDAPNAVTRLVDIGMESYKIASALRGVVAQRLLRRLCTHCRVPDEAPTGRAMAPWIPAGTRLFKAAGCSECAETGYRGRFSIVEILVMTPELEQLIGGGATADRIAEEARRGGMRSLFESGLQHVLEGVTSVDELLRVTDVPTVRTVSKPAATSAAPAAPAPPPPAATSAPAAPAVVTSELPGFELIDELILTDDDGQPLPKGTVLLVDDEESLRMVMKDLLERDGWTVQEAADGMEALAAVDQHAPDIILLDLNLPGLDGYEVLDRLRSRDSTRGVPIIVLTAKGDEDNEVRVLEAGADDFLTKPFRARALSARLDLVRARRRG
ncbi:MAG: type II/IV secretion system protein [Gemmatimonadales bacterium]|nr:type II/IV secretion system protein [Gemmatimonadales bacterium]